MVLSHCHIALQPPALVMSNAAEMALFCLYILYMHPFSPVFILQQEFFRKLMEVFRMCEDLENIDGLHMIFKIVKGIGQYSFLHNFDLDPYFCQLCLHSFL